MNKKLLHECNYHSKAESEIEESFCSIIAHLIEQSANNKAKKDVHTNSNQQIVLLKKKKN